MSSRKRCVRWFLLAIAALLVHPVFAAGVDCNRTHDPAARTICAYPKILALDSRLSSVYAAALMRDPSHANALKQDEVNWLGERNRQMWWLRARRRKFPSLPGNLETSLANFYQLRIAFVKDIDNPAVTRGMPIAQRLLRSAATLPAHATDPIKALEAAGVIILPKERSAPNPEPTISMLAAPPDAALRAALNRLGPYYGYTIVYLPSAGLGGAFNVGGTADCQYWVVFEKQGNVTVPINGIGSGLLDGCMRDGGSTGYLALIDGYPVALNVTNDPSFPNVTDFQWQRWLGGGKWGPTRRIRFRYGYSLKLSSMNYCPKTSPECTATAGVALSTAQRYMLDALALANLPGVSETEKTRFKHMLRLAPHRQDWAFCAYPVWFQTRLDGKIAIGGITESHIGCHPWRSALEVAFWGTRSNGTQWWFTDNTIDVDRQKLLFAALVLPSDKSR